MKKMLLLGDSISLHYGPYLKEYLKGQFEYYTKDGLGEALADINHAVQANCGDSRMLLHYLQTRSSGGNMDFDILAVNCGLHDIKRTFSDESIQIQPSEYEENLRAIFKLGKKHSIQTVFITTTPVDDERHNSRSIPVWGSMRLDKDVRLYNEIACRVAKENGICIIDLGEFTKKIGGQLYIDHVHYNQDIRALQAAFIAGSILSMTRSAADNGRWQQENG